ncbi:MAG: hypothetical protein AABY10_05875 [Nanoarchaeota archaeon]
MSALTMKNLTTYKITESPDRKKSNNTPPIYCCRVEENGSETSTGYYSSNLDNLATRVNLDPAFSESQDRYTLQNSQEFSSNSSRFTKAPLSEQEFYQFRRMLSTDKQ